MNIKIEHSNGNETIINLSEITHVFCTTAHSMELRSGNDVIGVINENTQVICENGVLPFDDIKDFLMKHMGE